MESTEWHEFEEFSIGFNAPETAGVYWIRDAREEVIYIGETRDIANRLLEHLRDKDHCMHKYGGLRFWYREIPDRIERENWEKIWIAQVRPVCTRRAG